MARPDPQKHKSTASAPCKRKGSEAKLQNNGNDDGHDDDDDRSASTRPSRKNLKASRPWTQLPTPEKSPVDPNDYRLIRLKNGVKALLVNRRVNDGSAQPQWASVYPESVHSGQGLNKIFQNEFQNLEATRKVDSHLKQSTLYSHTPSTTSGTALWSSVSSASSTTMKAEEVVATFGQRRTGGGRSVPTCAVSLMLGVGSHDDPVEFPGLAHLCEHLVHHGSAKFPGENDYHQAVELLGGGRNAFTDKGKTNYHFQVMQDPEFAGPAKIMQRLADLIGHPLFPLDAVRREIESVDNEYFMRKSTIHFRRDYLVNLLVVQDKKHPLCTFAIGNKDKLMPDDIEDAAERLQAALVQFHKKHYHADNITLVVQACLDLDVLEKYVGEIFSEIPRLSKANKVKKTPSTSGKTPYHSDTFNRLLTIKPLEDTNHLTIMWAFPPEAGRNYETKPLDFLGAYFDDGSSGGLEAYLKSRNLALKVAGGCLNHGPFRNDYVSVFLVDLLLTSQGRDRIQEVLEAIFSYLELIKEEGVTKLAYTQLQNIDRSHFKYFSPSASLGFLVQLSDNLRWCKDREVLYGHLRPFEFNKNLIKKYLAELTPSKAHYTLVTRNVGKVGFPHKEEIFGTKYLVQELPEDLLYALENVEIYDEFQLPDWSSSVPEKNIDLNKNIVELENPDMIVTEPHFTLQYFPTPGMRTPQVGCMIILATPWNLKNCIESGVADIWKLLLQDIIARDIQPWTNLGTSMKCQFMPERSRFYMSVTGLNYKMPELIDIILRNVVALEKNVSEEKFYAVKHYVVNMYENAGLDSTWLASDMLNMLQDKEYRPSVAVSERIKDNLTYQHFNTFTTKFKQHVQIEMALFGNATKGDASKIAQLVLKKRYFGFSVDFAAPPMELPLATDGKRVLPLGDRCFRIQSMNKESRISAIHNHYVLGKNGEENGNMAQLIHHCLKLHIFATLRTAQQLGYDVHSKLTRNEREIGLSIVVATHADKFCPCDVDSRIDEFLHAFYEEQCKSPELTSRDEYLDFFANGLTKVSGNTMRKVSIQVLACRGKNEETCVPQSRNESVYQCRKSVWLRDHKQPSISRLIIAVQESSNRKKKKVSDTAKLGYFIADIRDFHRNCDRF